MNYLSPKDVARRLGISEPAARRRMTSGVIASFRVGTKLWRAEQNSVDEHAAHLYAKNVAQQLGISQRTMTRLLRAGHVAGFRIGSKLWCTTQRAVDEYIRQGQYGRYRRQLPIKRSGTGSQTATTVSPWA